MTVARRHRKKKGGASQIDSSIIAAGAILVALIGVSAYSFCHQTKIRERETNIHNTIFTPSSPLSNFDNMYSPPLQNATGGVPMSYTQMVRGPPPNFQQVGIATDSEGLILPLFGRQIDTQRDKWQYYVVSNSGNVNSKLPVYVDKKDAMGEYGVKEASEGDSVFVKGYGRDFSVSIYNQGM